jgi:hypothetical protein
MRFYTGNCPDKSAKGIQRIDNGRRSSSDGLRFYSGNGSDNVQNTAEFWRPESRVGGVSLDGDLKVQALQGLQFSLTSLDDFHFDGFGKLVLSGSHVTGLDGLVTADDFLIALGIAFNNMDVHFSLDPWDPLDLDGGSLQKVFYPDMLANTAFGATLFQTDYDMKRLAFGLIPPPVPGFEDLPSRCACDKPKWSRLWIVSEDCPLIVTGSDSWQSVKFGPCRMRCCCRGLALDSGVLSGLRDDEHQEETFMTEFARRFTLNYDAIAAKCPHFERLRTLAKLLQLAKWIRKQPNTGIRRATVMEALKARGLPNTGFRNTGPLFRPEEKARTPQLKCLRRIEAGRTLRLIGGVSLATKLMIASQREPKEMDMNVVAAAQDAPVDRCQEFSGGIVFPLSLLR